MGNRPGRKDGIVVEEKKRFMEKEATGALRSRWFWAVFMICCLLGDVPSASAIQTHGAPEGLYAHQMAHLGFLVAMVYIWLRTRRRAGEGWGLIRLSFVFFAVWNVTTFINHGISATLDSTKFQGHIGPFPEFLVARSPIDLYFFFGQMDHFLCIPAALFLGLGLRKMRQATQLPSFRRCLLNSPFYMSIWSTVSAPC